MSNEYSTKITFQTNKNHSGLKNLHDFLLKISKNNSEQMKKDYIFKINEYEVIEDIF